MTGDARYTYSGTFTNAQFGGAGSRFTQHVTTAAAAAPTDELRALIGDLMALIEVHSDRIDQPDRAARDAEEIVSEAGRPSETRDPSRISDAFRRLRARLGPIAEFAESLGKIADALAKVIAL